MANIHVGDHVHITPYRTNQLRPQRVDWKNRSRQRHYNPISGQGRLDPIGDPACHELLSLRCRLARRPARIYAPGKTAPPIGNNVWIGDSALTH